MLAIIAVQSCHALETGNWNSFFSLPLRLLEEMAVVEETVF